MTITTTPGKRQHAIGPGVTRPAWTHTHPRPLATDPHRLASTLPFGTVQAKLTVGPANDRYEMEADRVADQVVRTQDAMLATRMPPPPSISPLHTPPAQRQPLEEEEEELQPKRLPGADTSLLQRQPDEEEEELLQPMRSDAAGTASVQRQAEGDEEEEEMLQPMRSGADGAATIQRQPIEEEEELLQPKR